MSDRLLVWSAFLSGHAGMGWYLYVAFSGGSCRRAAAGPAFALMVWLVAMLIGPAHPRDRRGGLLILSPMLLPMLAGIAVLAVGP